MPNYAAPDIGDSLKQLVSNVMGASQLSDISFGVVISPNPLQVQLNQKMILTDEYLILTNAVRDHAVDITVSWTTVDNTHKHGNGNNGQPTDDVTHNHGIQGRKKITIHNGLTAGEKVLLLRAQGGQKYVILDRVDEVPTEGESV